MNRRVKCQSYNRHDGSSCSQRATREAKIEINSADGMIYETIDVCQPHSLRMRAELVKTIAGLRAQFDAEIEIKKSGEADVDHAERIGVALLRAERALADLDRDEVTTALNIIEDVVGIGARIKAEHIVFVADRSAR